MSIAPKPQASGTVRKYACIGKRGDPGTRAADTGQKKDTLRNWGVLKIEAINRC